MYLLGLTAPPAGTCFLEQLTEPIKTLQSVHINNNKTWLSSKLQPIRLCAAAGWWRCVFCCFTLVSFTTVFFYRSTGFRGRGQSHSFSLSLHIDIPGITAASVRNNELFCTFRPSKCKVAETKRPGVRTKRVSSDLYTQDSVHTFQPKPSRLRADTPAAQTWVCVTPSS